MPDLMEFHSFSPKEVQYRKEITNLRKQVGEQSRKINKMMESDHEQEKLVLRRQIEELKLSASGTNKKLTQVLQQLRDIEAQQTESSQQPTPAVQSGRLL